MAAEAEWEERFFKHAAAMAASAAREATRDGTLPSLGREAIKDVRNTIHEIFFGCGEGMSEPGTPLNPTQGEIAAARREDMHPYGPSRQNAGPSASPASPAATVAASPQAWSPLPTAGDIANDRDISPPSATVHGQEQPQNLPHAGDIANDRDGQVLEQGKWTDRIDEERQKAAEGSNDGKAGYDRPQERIKPEEERREERERERIDFGR